MKIVAGILLTVIPFASAIAGGAIGQQDIPVFTDQDLNKYEKVPEEDLRQEPPENRQNEVTNKDIGEGLNDQRRVDTRALASISDAEKKNIEREFNKIVVAVKSQLEAGNIEGALAYFAEPMKDRHRQMFRALKDNKVLKTFLDGYMGVKTSWDGDHALTEFIRKENGQIYSYPISFMEVSKGVWKIYHL